MFSQSGRAPAADTGEGTTPGQRRAGRPPLDLGALEPRLLLAGWGDDPRTAPAVPAPAAVIVGPTPAPAVAAGGDDVEAYDTAPAPGRYVVVAETNAPHGTIATAQLLPDVPYAGVAGTVGPAGMTDVYRIPPGAGTLTLRLAGTAAGGSAGLRLMVLDGRGRVLDDLGSASGPIDVGLDLRRLGEEGLPVFVAVAPASAGAIAPAAGGYQLWVLRQPLSPPPAPGPAPTALPPTGMLATVPLTPSAGVSAAVEAAGDASGAGATAPCGLGGGPAPAVPSLAASPVAGLLGGDAPRVRAADAGWDAGLDLVDAAPRGPASAAAELADELEGATRPGATPALVAIREPGSPPRLGSGSIGDWRGSTAPAPAAPPSCHPAGPPRPLVAIAAVALPATVAARPATGNDPRAGSRPGLRPAAALTTFALALGRATWLDLAGRRPDHARGPRRRRRPHS